MVKCPNCGKELNRPARALRNSYFQIEAYNCDACGNQFKEARERNEFLWHVPLEKLAETKLAKTKKL